MDFRLSPKAEELRSRVAAFLERHVWPNEPELLHERELRPTVEEPYPPRMRALRGVAREEGLWNLFLPDRRYGAGLTNAEYAPACEVMGRSPIASEVFNCAAPDTGNMEILAEFGSEEQKKEWLEPMLAGAIRSCFSMTERHVSGADPTGLTTRAVRDGDHWVIDGTKWFTSGAYGARFAIAMVVTSPEAPRHQRMSQIIVPTDAPGFHILRAVPVMGHSGGSGHCEVRYEGCRVPARNLLGPEGAGFAIAQARLGPGRVHHCMRAVGAAERAIEMMCRRANERVAFGGPLGEKQFVQDMIARSRMEVDQARLLTLYAAWKMDTAGKRESRQEIAMIKVVAANVYMKVIDRAIQVFGAAGVSDDTPLALLWRQGRMLRIGDGPDEVHKMVIARRELARFPAVERRDVK
jgi:acyl-CoA dehydrogenase